MNPPRNAEGRPVKAAPNDSDASSTQGNGTTLARTASGSVYGTSAVKRTRRTQDEMAVIRAAIFDLLMAEQPMTNRQCFYRLETTGHVPKSEAGYKTVCRFLADMRLSGQIPFGWIADNTRWMRKPQTYSDAEHALRELAAHYRKDIWRRQPFYVEVWLEKDALAGVVDEVTRGFDVPLMVTRGYASLSYLHEAAEAIAAKGKPAYLYYFGDYDPSGADITANVERRLRQFAPDAEIHFERRGVTEWQIANWKLPTRPTKTSDSRARKFADERSVELDAIPPERLREMVSQCIEKHVDQRELRIARIAEESERESLRMVAS